MGAGRRVRTTVFKVIVLLVIVLVVLTLGLYTAYSLYYRKLVYSTSQVPNMQVAIVFGAGIWPDGRLSDILADRVDTAINLYLQGRVRKLLFTGDNRYLNYNEPQRMAEYAIERGVPEADIVLDYAGRRTYDSCYRALHIFEVDSAILVTQAYHLPRALFTADRMGIRVVGVPADRHEYVYILNYRIRELLATPVAWWQVLISHPLPVLGPKLPIFPPD